MTEYILSFSLLIASILLIRAIFRKKASARLIYALWLAVIIKLCIPFSFINVDLPDIQYAGTPSTEAIVPSTTEKEDAQAAPSPIDPSPSYDTNVEIPETAKPSSNIPNTSKKIEPAFDYRRIFTTVWVAGSSIVFLVIAVSVTVFNIKLLRSRTYYKSIGKTKIYVSDITASPCVAGIVPTIYITTLARTSDKLSLVVLHEKSGQFCVFSQYVHTGGILSYGLQLFFPSAIQSSPVTKQLFQK